MTAYLLFHPYDFGNRPTTYVHVDFWCGLFGLLPAVVHQDGMLEPSSNSPVPIFQSLSDARSSVALGGLTWVWLDEAGSNTLDSYAHPADNVVYVLGQEQAGFGDVPTPGDHLRVDFPTMQEAVASPSMVVPLLCYDRWAYLHGGRG